MANILITGASRGIGKSIAEKLSNHNLFLTARNEEALKILNPCDYCICDLADDINTLVNFVKGKEINILINNAGEYIYKNVEELSFDEINRLVRINLEIPMLLASVCTPCMKEQKWGRIINIGSISGVMGEAFASVYSATKAGLIGFTKAAGLELAGHGITVNTINPGWVETDLGLESINESEFTLEETLQTIPQRRFVQPEEVASLVEYLISNEARGVTGQSINICAGLSVGI
ncbi:SDR family oxidoreductase [bacterium]|nr:SDR family oxidoreductase [bacterium]